MSGYFPPEIRAVIRQRLQSDGVPHEELDEIVDLAIHGAESAQETLKATLYRASSDAVAICAVGIAYSLLKILASEQLKSIQQKAQELGLPTHGMSIQP